MATIPIWSSKSMDSDIAAAAGPLKVLAAPKGMTYKVDLIASDKAVEEACKDPQLKHTMIEAAKQVYDELIAAIGKNLQDTDKGGIVLRKANEPAKLQKLVDVVNAGIRGAVGVAQEQGEKAVLAAWQSLKTKRLDVKKYKIKIGVSIGTAVASLVASVAVIAATPFTFGATTPFAIIGMVKSVVTLGREIGSAALTVEESQKVLKEQLKMVESFLVESKKDPGALALSKLGKANEYNAAVIQAFFGISQPCIKTCEKNLGTAKNKLKGIDTACNSMSKELNKILDATDTLKSECLAAALQWMDLNPQVKALSPSELQKRMDDHLAPNEALANGLLAKLIDQIERVKKVSAASDELVKRVAELSDVRGKGVVWVENVLAAASVLLSPMGGDGLASVEVFAQRFGQAAAAYTVDRIRDKVLSGSFLV